MPPASDLPVGTVTFLFTDIEGSTRLLQALGPAYGDLLQEHNRLLTEAVLGRGGQVFGTEGDALAVVFRSATGAVEAAATGQQALAGHAWPAGVEVRVRMGIHTGEVALAGENYVGIDLHRTARINAAGHGGQVLVSSATCALVDQALPDGVSLRDLGERRLKDLSRPEHIYQLVIPGLASDFPALRTLDTIVNNLPTQLTSFVGRTHETAVARALLERSRLLTLTGPGGTGKTRLSLQIAAEIADQFAGGAFFVPLDAVIDPALVASAIVSALGLQDSGVRTPRDRLLEYLAERRVLLILDNFEQVTEAAPLVAEILRACPGCSVIVSSRAVLHVSGEQEYAVPPLALPDRGQRGLTAESLSQYEGVALFIERAVAVRPEFRVTNENAPAVAEICVRLDGLPLAIELAAARIKLLPPEAILARLDQRLGLLSSGSRDLPARQQTLRGAIAWSYDLLDPGTRRLLARAAVFNGGMGLEEAEIVCGPAGELGVDVFDGLASLVDQSLMRQAETAGDPRFGLLQTIRDYALERLAESGEMPEIERRHADVYLAVAVRAEPELTGPRQRLWLDRLEREHDNVRTALTWAIRTGAAETAAELCGALWRFWQMRGYLQEAWDRVTNVLAMAQLADDPVARRRALDAAGGIAYWQGDMEKARGPYSESLALARQFGDTAAKAEALYNLAFLDVIVKGNVARGTALAEESVALYRELDDPMGIARSLWGLGNAHYFGGRFDSAGDELRESVARFRALDEQFGLGWSLHTLGLTEYRLGQFDAARTHWGEMLRIFAAAGDVSGIGTGLYNFRAIAIIEGDLLRAAQLGGAAAALVISTGTDLTSVIEQFEARPMPEVAVSTVAEIDAAEAAGQAMSLPEIVAFALERAGTPAG